MIISPSKKAFTLIEVIIASAILSITVFGVYKLIGENSKLINNSQNYFQLNTLFPALQECIKSRGFTSYTQSVGTTLEFNFGNDLHGCNIGNSHQVIIDNLLYTLEGNIVNKDTGYIDWLLIIEGEGIGIEKKNFRLLK